jgi:hypothetical protein
MKTFTVPMPEIPERTWNEKKFWSYICGWGYKEETDVWKMSGDKLLGKVLRPEIKKGKIAKGGAKKQVDYIRSVYGEHDKKK